jgi:cytochrome c-type biogenesis protein CcmH/NrfG
MAAGGSQYRSIARLARRGIPIAIEAYRRWQQLTPEQRERYLALARQYAERANRAVQARRGRRR